MIIGICGEIGAGKSLKQLQLGLELANKRQRQLVLNFPVNLEALRQYAIRKRYAWILHLIRHDLILQLDGYDLQRLTSFQNAVILIDEAAIFLNSEFENLDDVMVLGFLTNLRQTRKDRVDVIWVSQLWEDVYSQCRELTQLVIQAQGVTRFDSEMGIPRLKRKQYFHFTKANYERWLADGTARANILRTVVRYTSKVEFGPVSAQERDLFGVFNTLERIDGQTRSSVLRSLDFCYLPQSNLLDSLPPQVARESLPDVFEPVLTELMPDTSTALDLRTVYQRLLERFTELDAEMRPSKEMVLEYAYRYCLENNLPVVN